MKILAFTFEAPSKVYGGGLGIIQSLASLTATAEVDYVGPCFDQSEFPEIHVHKAYFLKDENSAPAKAFNLLRGVTTRYYQEWKRVSAQLHAEEYDLVFMDFSYNDFIMDWAHAHGLRTVVRVHNIEQDMAANTAHSSVHDKYWFRALLNGWIINQREAKVMRECSRLIFLTKEDLDRACELYGEAVREHAMIVPVCMSVPALEESAAVLSTPYILATGSLYYGPNAEGIKWFLKYVWANLQNGKQLEGIQLVVAGRKPDGELKQLIEATPNCTLVDSPAEMAPYFQHASLYVAPVFSGAGMKVKVAEALSYGLTVIGAHHALIGYEEAAPFVLEANQAEEFSSAVVSYFAKEHTGERVACVERFKQLYTMQRSADDFYKAMEHVRSK